MNPADLTLPTRSPTLATKNLPTPQSSAQKNGKTPVPRVDSEPIYTQLKAALGDGWAGYKAAVSAFICGKIRRVYMCGDRDADLETQVTSTKPSSLGSFSRSCSQLPPSRR